MTKQHAAPPETDDHPRPSAGAVLGALRRQMLPRQMGNVMAASFATWVLFAVKESADGHRVTSRIEVAFAVFSAIVWIAIRRFPRAIVPLSHAGLLVSTAGVVALAWVTGQSLSPALWYVVAMPLFAGYLFGLRAAAAWTAGTMIAIGGVELGRRFYPVTPEVVLTAADVTARMMALVVLLFALSIATNRVHKSQIELLQQREVKISELAGGLEQKGRELEVARDGALTASRTKSEFLAMMSHEIRTPLNGVLGLTSVLLDSQLPIEQREIVRTIRSSGDALLSLLNDMLELSRLGAGEDLTLEQAPFSLVDCAEDALDLFAAPAAEKGLDLCLVTSPEVPALIDGDSARIRQLLVNLVSNAVKFTLRGSVELRLRAERVEGDDPAARQIHCEVRDTGIGIPEEMVSRLFEPFSQLDPSSTRRFGGTGLGLAICRTLADRMRGGISVHSEPGVGTTFHVHFPARVVTLKKPPVEEVRGGGRAALIVTPRSGSRASIASHLATWGFRTIDAATCGEARDLVAGGRADLVVAEEPDDPAQLPRLLNAAGSPPLVLLATGKLEGTARAALRERWSRAVPIVGMPVRRVVLRDAVGRALDPGAGPPPLSNPAPIAEAKPLRILVAEDNPVNQRVALLLLEQLGYRADLAGNGAEAIAALKSHPYDVVFMDVRMPEVDGLEATRTIRRTLPRERQPRIIALTANAMAEDRRACAAAGMDDFLPKPLLLPTLERALREHPAAEAPPVEGALVDETPLDALKIESLRELTASEPEVLAELLRDYFAAADRQIAQIEAGLLCGDAAAVVHAAHSLKGGSGQMGAWLVMNASARLEQLAKTEDLEGARAALSALVKEQERAAGALRAAVDRPR